MAFVLPVVGLLMVLSILALFRAVREARDGYEDKTGFHFANGPLVPNWAGKHRSPARPSRMTVKRTAPKQAA